MTSNHDRQEAFHRHADAGRFRNRLENPFIASKELSLAQRIAQRAVVSQGGILEVGCGEGSNLYYLRRALPERSLVGLDFSWNKVGFLGQRVDAAGVCGNALALPFGDAAFAMVMLRDLLHHVDWNREQVLREALRVTKPGGVVVILESDGRTLLNRVFGLLYPAERGGRNSTPDRLMALGQDQGPTRLEWVEASFALRAWAFFLGWPTGWRRGPVAAIYHLLSGWEWVVAHVYPRSRWMYMLLTVSKPPPDHGDCP